MCCFIIQQRQKCMSCNLNNLELYIRKSTKLEIGVFPKTQTGSLEHGHHLPPPLGLQRLQRLRPSPIQSPNKRFSFFNLQIVGQYPRSRQPNPHRLYPSVEECLKRRHHKLKKEEERDHGVRERVRNIWGGKNM